MKKFLGGSRGFTLVELMVVVAIIGILSAIAVPNFKKYQAKSKQSEAKIQLAAVYATEVASNADYDTYATCIGDLGYETPPKGYYIVGFSADHPASTQNVVDRGGQCTSATFAISPPTAVVWLKASGVTTSATDLIAIGSTPATAFTAAAAGNISGDGITPFKDRWTIDQTKALKNVLVGY